MGADPGLVWRAASVVGFLCLVGAYIANQRGACRADSVRYLVSNVVGAGILALYSAIIGEWVFVALEGFWCGASVHALATVGRRRAAKPLESES